MDQAQHAAERLMVKPIFDYLQGKDPAGKYKIRNKEIMYGEGFAFGYSIKIYKAGETFWSRMFPKKIAQIKQGRILGNGGLEVESFDNSLVDEKELEDICRSIDFDGLRFAGALLAGRAIDYF